MKIVSCAIEGLRKLAVPGWRSRAVAGFVNALFRTFKPRARVVRENLALAFPEKSDAEREEIRRKMYRHLSWVITEQLVLQRDQKQSLSWIDEIEGEEYINELLAQKKGAVLVSAHFGNWELFMAWGAPHGYPLATVARGPNDPDLDALLSRYRANSGLKVFDRRGQDFSPLKVAKFLKAGGFLALAGDVHEGSGVRAPFFGRDCMTPIGAATFALLAQVPVIPYFLYRKAPFSHKAVIGKPIKVPAHGTRDEKIEAMTREINAITECAVRNAPELWFWMHRRWKI